MNQLEYERAFQERARGPKCPEPWSAILRGIERGPESLRGQDRRKREPERERKEDRARGSSRERERYTSTVRKRERMSLLSLRLALPHVQ
ncbi:Hypothetical protein NTJ_14435 [Nesidiocoris tenuis]|uniref:Uncharacterized protein n=1 Tax=Nesidiocoris tenuis TaxID=355587 RepID=A0ABN7BBH3_9HEMI|nr:Hypothetical protein NTJ_14435 [Nesidiocoris tenuis]